jgi:ProP effector
MTFRARNIAQIREELVQLFPACFAGKGKPKPPLKKGIFRDIINRMPGGRGLKQWHLGRVLDDYTHGPTYLASLVEGATRVDLDGNPAGEVSASDAEHAAKKLALIRADMEQDKARREVSRQAVKESTGARP